MGHSSVQPAGTALLLVRTVPSSGNANQRIVASQQLATGKTNVTSISLPAVSGGLRQVEIAEVSLNGSAINPPQSQRARQELLWRKYFLDPALWWDNRQHKKSSRSPDFRHKETKEAIWLDSFYKPAWVDAQLAALDMQTTSTSNSVLLNDSEFQTDFTAESVRKLSEKGQLSEAVHALGLLVQAESRISVPLLYSVLKRCVAEKDLILGRRVHDLIVQTGHESNTFLGNHVLRMYAGQGRLQEAMDVFTRVSMPDAFMWSSIITAHAKHGEDERAIQLYHLMRSSGVKPDGHVFVAALQACASAADLESGMQVHSDVLESGVPPDSFVCSCLVDMYAKCGKLEEAHSIFDNLITKDVVTCTAMIAGYAKRGRLEDARKLFDSLDARDVVTWNAMIAGYVEQGLGQEALALYTKMEQEGVVVPSTITFVCLLQACGNLAALQQGKQLHAQILKRGLEREAAVGNGLVDMFAKCGQLKDARRIFDSLPSKSVVTWTNMINGYGQSNEGHKAIECYEEMVRAGVQADETTFTCLLVACSHDGLVEEGRQIFKTMEEKRGITPTVKLCNCMVDLLGRGGYLEEAETMLLSFKGDDVGYKSLLSACRSHRDVERGIRCFERLIRADSQNAAAYVLMGNIYADAGRWSDVEAIEKLRKSIGANKKPAVAGIEVNRHVHTFVVGEERGDISSKVRSMSIRLKEGGHVPHTELVLKQLPENEKENELCGHAEKLALAFGLLNTPAGTPLLVTKNLRMCKDCHSSTEIMSKIEKREIVVRDGHRVHRFVDGSCRCGGRP